jgi:outer membrane protein assembly factor BamB
VYRAPQGEDPDAAHARAAPVVGQDGTAYLGLSRPRLFAVAANGSQLWSVMTVNNGDVYGAAALSADGATVFWAATDGDLAAADARDGTVLWRVVTGARIASAPLVHPSTGAVYVGCDDAVLRCVAADGKWLWNRTLGTAGSDWFAEGFAPALSLESQVPFRHKKVDCSRC